jgi:two-component system chemotaxis response regulator CheY
MTKILIVDDLEDNRIIIKSILKNIKDIEIFEAEDGAVAVEISKQEQIDITLMDIMMPVMDGFEATKQIKQNRAETIVIVITAFDDEETEKKVRDIGADSFFIKPIDYDILRYKIQNFIQFIEIKKNSKMIFTKKNAINPFNNDIRNMKIFYYITNEDDMMDFGTWLIDYQNTHSSQLSILSCSIVDFLYKIMIDSISKHENLTIIIEDGFDAIYINLAIPKLLDDTIIKSGNILGKNLKIKDGFIHLVLHMAQVSDINILNEEVTTPTEVKIEEKEDNTFIDFDFDDTRETVDMNEQDRLLLRQSHIDKVSAKDFVMQIEGSIIDEIHDLVELEENWQVLLDKFDLKPEEHILIDISDILAKYSSVINSLYSFMALSYALSSLSTFFRNLSIDSISQINVKKFILLLGCIKSDLIDWRENIFEKQETMDIHYLDSSLFSSCMQIESMLTNKIADDNEESDLELF